MDFILNSLSYVWWVLLAIMILVFVHEMGHFLFAKLFKMRVERFSVGFPPKVLGFTKGETEYVLGLTPLGGYVKISGMVDESMDTDELESEPEPWEFRAKPVWQRILVIIAGVTFNMILAAGIYIGLKATYGEAVQPTVGDLYVADSSVAYNMGLRTGDELVAINDAPVGQLDREAFMALLTDRMTISVRRGDTTLAFQGPEDIMTQLGRSSQSAGFLGISFDPALVGEVISDAPAQEIGLQRGDKIVAINGEPVRFFSELTSKLQTYEGAPVQLTWVRPASEEAFASDYDAPGTRYEVEVTPRQESDGRYVLGFFPFVTMRDYGLGEAVGAGLADTWFNTRFIGTSLKRVFTGRENFRENVGGPIMIARATKEAADGGAFGFWRIVAMLSITLAIINILPIPALDGGHLVFLLYEAITRREPSLKVRMVTQQIGMIVLLVFMTFLIFNDVLRLWS